MIDLEKSTQLPLPDNLEELAAQYKTSYQQAAPFPFVVLDNFLPTQTANLAAQQFPVAGESPAEWYQVNNSNLVKKTVGPIEKISPLAQQIMQLLSGPVMLRFLEQLTGIPALMPDPYQIGRGLQSSPNGGFLEVHADGNFHETLHIYRRVNLLLYLTPGWSEEFGGHLELWNDDMTRCVERVLPLFNRCLLFTITPNSFHGYPQPITCPPEMTRNLISLVYCTSAPPEDDSQPRYTLWQKRLPAPPEPIKLTLDYDKLSREEAHVLLKQRERELALRSRENDNLMLRLGEARENVEILLNYERNMLIHRVGGAEHWVSSLQQQVAELEEKLRLEHEASHEDSQRLITELAAVQQWAKEMEQQLSQRQGQTVLTRLRQFLKR